jgi:stalled ribosome rescue protein Dom34
MVQSNYINKGQFHSIKVEYNQPLRIIKQSWDKYLKELVKECTD